MLVARSSLWGRLMQIDKEITMPDHDKESIKHATQNDDDNEMNMSSI